MLASCSVTRPGLEGIATDGVVAVCIIEVLP